MSTDKMSLILIDGSSCWLCDNAAVYHIDDESLCSDCSDCYEAKMDQEKE